METFGACLTWPRFEEESTGINTDSLMNIREIAAKKQKTALKQPVCIPCKTHAGVPPVARQVYAKVTGWWCKDRKNPVSRFALNYASTTNEYSLGHIHAATPTGKLTPCRRSSGLSSWNAPWESKKLSILTFV